MVQIKTSLQLQTLINGGSAILKGEAAQAVSYTAFYPYTEDGSLSFSDNTISFNLPSEQIAQKGSFNENLNPSWAQTTDGNTELTFKNICTLVKFTLTDELQKIKKVKFEGISNENLSGNCTYNIKSNNCTSDNNNGVTLTGIQGSGTYYIVLCPTNLSSGFKISFLDEMDNLLLSKETDKNVTLNSGKIIDLGDSFTISNNGYEVVDGTYYVYNKSGLMEWIDKANYKDLNCTLMSDIDFGYDYTLSSYKGIFDGNGKTIKNFSSSPLMCTSFFGRLEGATVKNVKFENSKVYNTGIIANECIGSTIENCHLVNGNINISFDFTSFDGDLKVGGIAGKLNNSSIIGCSFSGQISHYRNNFTTTDCNLIIGGIAGVTEDDSSIICSYSKSFISILLEKDSSSTYSIGGIAGKISSCSITSSCYSGSIKYSTSEDINQPTTYIGCIAGNVESATCKAVYYSFEHNYNNAFGIGDAGGCSPVDYGNWNNAMQDMNAALDSDFAYQFVMGSDNTPVIEPRN